MDREEPYFAKCCYVIPLTLCLQTWAVLKLVANIFAVVGALVGAGYATLLFLFISGSGIAFAPLLLVILFVLLTIAICVDFGFTVLLIVGVAKKNLKMLQKYYSYDIYLIIMETVLFIGFFIGICYVTEANICALLALFAIGVLLILLDVFVFFALKSEMIKLRNKEQYSFEKLPPSEFEGVVLYKSEEI